MTRFAYIIVAVLTVVPVYAQDSMVSVTLRSEQTAGGQSANLHVMYIMPTTSGQFDDPQVGDTLAGIPTAASSQVRIYGWGPMTAGFWYKRILVNTSTSTVQAVFPWARGELSIAVGNDNNLVVDLTIEGNTTTLYPLTDTDSVPSNGPSLGYDAWARLSFSETANAGDVGTTSYSDTYAFVRLIDVQTAGFVGGGGGDSKPGDSTPGSNSDYFDVGTPTGDTDYSFSSPGSSGTLVWSQLIAPIDGIVAQPYGTMVPASDLTVRMETTYYQSTPIKPVVDTFFLGFCSLFSFMLPYRSLLRKH